MQQPDGKPGYYYVTAQDRGKTALLLGPFVQRRPGTLAHRQALGLVASARAAVNRIGYSGAALQSVNWHELADAWIETHTESVA